MEYRNFGAEGLGAVTALFVQSGWRAYLKDEAALCRALENSLFLLGAFEGGRLVGFVRCVGDGEHIVYVQDLIVDADFRRRGIGRELMRRTMERFAHVRMLTLITDAQDAAANAFYRSIGMKPYAENGLAGYFR